MEGKCRRGGGKGGRGSVGGREGWEGDKPFLRTRLMRQCGRQKTSSLISFRHRGGKQGGRGRENEGRKERKWRRRR